MELSAHLPVGIFVFLHDPEIFFGDAQVVDTVMREQQCV